MTCEKGFSHERSCASLSSNNRWVQSTHPTNFLFRAKALSRKGEGRDSLRGACEKGFSHERGWLMRGIGELAREVVRTAIVKQQVGAEHPPYDQIEVKQRLL